MNPPREVKDSRNRKKAWRQWNVGIVYPQNTSSKRPLKQQDRETQHV